MQEFFQSIQAGEYQPNVDNKRNFINTALVKLAYALDYTGRHGITSNRNKILGWQLGEPLPLTAGESFGIISEVLATPKPFIQLYDPEFLTSTAVAVEPIIQNTYPALADRMILNQTILSGTYKTLASEAVRAYERNNHFAIPFIYKHIYGYVESQFLGRITAFTKQLLEPSIATPYNYSDKLTLLTKFIHGDPENKNNAYENRGLLYCKQYYETARDVYYAYLNSLAGQDSYFADKLIHALVHRRSGIQGEQRLLLNSLGLFAAKDYHGVRKGIIHDLAFNKKYYDRKKYSQSALLAIGLGSYFINTTLVDYQSKYSKEYINMVWAGITAAETSPENQKLAKEYIGSETELFLPDIDIAYEIIGMANSGHIILRDPQAKFLLSTSEVGIGPLDIKVAPLIFLENIYRGEFMLGTGERPVPDPIYYKVPPTPDSFRQGPQPEMVVKDQNRLNSFIDKDDQKRLITAIRNMFPPEMYSYFEINQKNLDVAWLKKIVATLTERFAAETPINDLDLLKGLSPLSPDMDELQETIRNQMHDFLTYAAVAFSSFQYIERDAVHFALKNIINSVYGLDTLKQKANPAIIHTGLVKPELFTATSQGLDGLKEALEVESTLGLYTQQIPTLTPKFERLLGSSKFWLDLTQLLAEDEPVLRSPGELASIVVTSNKLSEVARALQEQLVIKYRKKMQASN